MVKGDVKYIGLDISTSIIGVCLISYKKEIVLLDSIDLRKIKCIFKKSIEVENRFNEYKDKYNFCEDLKISIEEAFQSFSKGFSSAKTLSQLNRFNGIVSYITYQSFCSVPLYINVNSARKNLQIKIEKKSSLNTKEQIFEWVKPRVGDFSWPTKKLKSGPNKGVVKFDECCYDISDAFVICKALIYNEENNLWKNRFSWKLFKY